MSDSVTNTRGPESTESESANLENIAVTVALNDARGGIFFMWSKVSMLKLSVKETKKSVTDNHGGKVSSVFNERFVPRLIHTEVEVNRGRSADVDLKHDDLNEHGLAWVLSMHACTALKESESDFSQVHEIQSAEVEITC